ncbi:MAG: HD domain-containing protein [Candidatus Helarchaeota archaeon]
MPEKALEFARQKHAGQRRKVSNAEYVVHPINVAKILEKYGCQEPFLSAALLHDTIEDTSTTYDEILVQFGRDIADLVRELTNDKREIKKIGKTQYLLEKLKNMSSKALTIKLADRLDNIRDLHLASKEFRERYYTETKEILQNLRGSLTSLQQELRKQILETLDDLNMS